ncbi:MAG: alpha/beta hydrolase [Calothrix sp. MO_167.B42]|nr:alpha/beta hydrolase [Calothrix sp. MO_167.B42]
MLKKVSRRKQKFHQFLLNSLFVATISTLATTIPANAAEKIYAAFGPLDFSVSVADLENFVQTGKVTPKLKLLIRRLNTKQKEELRTTLQQSYDVKPVLLSQYFYSPMGENVLRRAGKIIQTKSGQNGMFALRAALILAAAEGDFTLVKVLQKFPTSGIRINTPETIKIIKEVGDVFADTKNAITQINKLSQGEIAAAPTIDYNTLPDIRTLGPVKYSSQTIYLKDTSRDRKYPVVLYLPPTNSNSREKIPVVIISHGFADSPKSFAELGKFLASHGFAVALPEHIGSNFAYQEATLAGRGRELFRLNEFIDRPLDVTFLLNYLEGLNQSDFQGRLNLKKVGIIGHSFGGYTALMLGGATIDFQQLQSDCQQEYFNISSLLQCRAKEFKPASVQRKILSQGLKDDRIQLLITLNPVSSIVFGQKGLSRVQVPVIMGSGGYDPATPLVTEQIRAFNWLETPKKYLVVADGFSHSSELTTLINSLLFSSSNSQNLENQVKALQQNARAIMLAFLRVYIEERSQYVPYVQPSYPQFISQPPFDLSLIRSLTPEQWEKIIGGKKE